MPYAGGSGCPKAESPSKGGKSGRKLVETTPAVKGGKPSSPKGKKPASLSKAKKPASPKTMKPSPKGGKAASPKGGKAAPKAVKPSPNGGKAAPNGGNSGRRLSRLSEGTAPVGRGGPVDRG